MKAKRVLKNLCKVLASVALLGSVAVVNTNQPAAVEAAKKAKKSTKKAAKKTSKKVAKKTTKKSAKKAVKKPAKKSAKSTKKVAKKTTKKSAKKSVKKAAKKPVKKVAKKVAKPAKKATKKSTKKIVKKISKKAVKKVAKKSSKKKTKKSVKKPSNNVAKKTTAPANTIPKTTTPTNTTPKTTTPTNKDTNSSTKSVKKLRDADRYTPVLVPNAHISVPYRYMWGNILADTFTNDDYKKIFKNYKELPIDSVTYLDSETIPSGLGQYDIVVSDQAFNRPVGQYKTKLKVIYDDRSEDVVGPVSLTVTPVEAQKHYPLKLKTKSIKIKAFRKKTEDGWTTTWKLQDEIPIYSTDDDPKISLLSFGEDCLISGDDAKKLFINGGDIKEACLATKETILSEHGTRSLGVATYKTLDGGGIELFEDHDGPGSYIESIQEIAAAKADQLCIMCLYKDNSVAVSDPVTVNWDLTQIPDFYDDED